MNLRLIAAAAAFAVTTGTLASAHHSVEGAFEPGKRIQLTGVISKVQWTNPHIYVYLDVKDGTNVTTWELETIPTAAMRRAGVTMKMLMGEGQPVVVDAYPARDGTKNYAFILRITYPDGHSYQLYNNPDATR